MSLFEFQMSAATFLALQRNTLRAQRICLPPLISLGPLDIVIDRLQFGANTLRHSVPKEVAIFYNNYDGESSKYAQGLQTQIAQQVTVNVTTLGDILAHPNANPE